MFRFLKKLFLFLFVLVLLLIGAFLVVSFYDEPLEEGYESFFDADVVADAQNGDIELMGIVAPEDQDARTFAQAFIDRTRKSMLTATYEDTYEDAGDNDYKIADVEKLREESDRLACWYNQEEMRHPGEECLPKEELVYLIAQYSFLIERLHRVNRYQHFDMPKGIGIDGTKKSGQTLIATIQLELARITLLLQSGQYEDAVRNWESLAVLSQKMISGHQTLVGQAIAMLNFGMVHDYAAVLIDLLPADRRPLYQDRITKVLDFKVLGEKSWDVQKTMQAEEYAIVRNLELWFVENPVLRSSEGPYKSYIKYVAPLWVNYAYKDSMFKNSFYIFARDMVNLANAPIEGYKVNLEIFQEKYMPPKETDHWKYVAPNLVGTILLPALTKGSELISNAHRKQAYLDLLKIYVAVKTQGIAPQDMEGFVAKHQQDKTYPTLTYHWDSEKNMIYLDPFDDYKRVEILYVKS